jgi:hypothetical protein
MSEISGVGLHKFHCTINICLTDYHVSSNSCHKRSFISTNDSIGNSKLCRLNMQYMYMYIVGKYKFVRFSCPFRSQCQLTVCRYLTLQVRTERAPLHPNLQTICYASLYY